jgi:predicted DNA-binding protein (UPF0251 family)
MARPKCSKHVESLPQVRGFAPIGLGNLDCPVVVLTIEEREALRLADRDGLYQEEASLRMGVSRPTFARLITTARQKTAHALIEGCLLLMEGGDYHVNRVDDCPVCASKKQGHQFVPHAKKKKTKTL